MSRVAVVGLGAMGSRIAERLLAAGHDLVVWNRTAAKAEALVAAGARAAETPAAATAQRDVVLTMVADPAALRAVTEGDAGVAAGIAPGATLVEMSTVGPAAVARLAQALPDGVGLLDAPVLGSQAEAEAGSLRIFVGGPADVFERWRRLLAELGTPLHAGGRGAGAAAKLVVNSTLFGAIGALGEAIALADGLGLSRETAFAVLSASPLAAQAERRRESVERGEFPPRFGLSLARKDASLVVEAADEAGVDMRLAEAARTWLADAEAAGLGEHDYSAVLALILRRVGSA